MVGAAPAPDLIPGSPGLPETPKKNSQNTLVIPGMSQNNSKALFSLTTNYIRDTLVNLKMASENLISLNPCLYPYVVTDGKSEA